MVKAEILAIGDELCYGRVYDTNSFWLADQVTRMGVQVDRITCIRDDVGRICDALTEALNRKPRFIFITGGLGPTDDDRTMEALSRLTGRSVIIDEKVLKTVAERRKLTPSQLLQHHLRMSSTLEGAECLPNPVGWAPLTILRMGGTTVFAMPGPPREVQGCFKIHLVAEIEKVTHYHSIARRVVVTMFESKVTPIISRIIKAIPNIYLKPLVGDSTPGTGLPVEIIVFGKDDEACQKKYSKTLRMLSKLVGKEGREVKEA